MPLIKPFPGLRPVPERAADVAAPPYDVLNSTEARERAKGRPYSFLHISKAEIDLPEDTDPFDARVYAKAAENLGTLKERGILLQDQQRNYYVYRITMQDHQQTGLVAAASVGAYDENRIRKHEFTRPSKEDDRVRQIEALNAQTGPVLMAYRSDQEVDALLARMTNSPADYDVSADDGIRHELWVVSDADLIADISAGFERLYFLYIADGHHRSAAASRVAATRREQDGGADSDPDYNYFLSVIFPHNQLQIFDYNRVVTDLGELSPREFLEMIAQDFQIESSQEPVRPGREGEFGMYLGGQWYRLIIHEARIPTDDPVASLDVSLLADNLLAPVLGIEDVRTDPRIDFVGGVRGLEGLEKRVDSGEMVVAFSLFPTRMEALMAVADAGEVMPPKSTWFEPKLADGLISLMLES